MLSHGKIRLLLNTGMTIGGGLFSSAILSVAVHCQ